VNRQLNELKENTNKQMSEIKKAIQDRKEEINKDMEGGSKMVTRGRKQTAINSMDQKSS
jgi:hypothetical protein